jgi:quercetin dioxygenase-like cupin family protein
MNLVDLKEKEVFKKEERGFANLIDETYLQMNQVCLEPGQQIPHHNANSNVTLMVVHGEGTFTLGTTSPGWDLENFFASLSNPL